MHLGARFILSKDAIDQRDVKQCFTLMLWNGLEDDNSALIRNRLSFRQRQALPRQANMMSELHSRDRYAYGSE